jgi:hypothetical protein
MSDNLLPLIRVSGSSSLYNPYGADDLLYGAFWDGTVTDHSIGANTITNNGPAGFVATGIQLTGTQYLSLASSLVTGANPFTLLIWVNYAAISGTQTTFAMGTGNANQAWIVDMTNAGNLNGGYWGHGQDYYANLTFTYNTWYNFAFTSDGTAVQNAYWNGGHLAAKGLNSATPNIVSGVTRIGRQLSSFTNYVSGIIGEVLLFNRVFSTSEVAYYFNSTRFRYGV